MLQTEAPIDGEAAQAFSAREFRDALSAFATGVTIVTARDARGEPVGMTASSFNSVSTDPPLILWSVTRTALSAPAFRAAKHFSVHVLATDQSDLSNLFAQRGADKFADIDFEFDARGVPILRGMAARFDCSTHAVHEGGDHWIIVGRVEGLVSSRREGLVFGGGAYATASPLATASDEYRITSASAAPIENMLFYHLSRAYHAMGHEFHEAVRASGLTVAEWRICASLFGETVCTRSELSRRTFLDPDTLSEILTGMAADGLCALEGKGAEAQVKGTRQGHEKVVHLFALADEHEQRALARIPPAQARTLKDSLKRMIENTKPPVD